MAGIEHKSLGQPDTEVDYGEQGKAAKVTLGMAGFGLGSESTVWLSIQWIPPLSCRTARTGRFCV